MDKREQLIREGLNKWSKNNFKGILKYGTGVGKSYAAVLSVEHFYKRYPQDPILIVAPTIVILENLKKEFIKFKRGYLITKCNFICYASITKVNKQYSLIVLDELHHITTDLRMTFFKKIRYRAMLGLSASLTKEQLRILSPYLKIVDTIDINKAQELSLVANYTILNIPVNFTTSERITYNKLSSQIDYIFTTYQKRAWRLIGKRSELLYNAENKLKILPKILELFKDEYGIIFSITKNQSEEITSLIGDSCITIHSGKTKKEQETLVKNFSDGRTKVKIISTAKIFDEGVTLPRLSFAILVSRYSKERQGVQNIGRVCRTDLLNKHSIIVRIYVKDTKEEEWVKESQKNFKPKFINSYENLKKEVQKSRSNSVSNRKNVTTSGYGVPPLKK